MANSKMDPRDRFLDEDEIHRRNMEAWQTHMWTALPTLVEKHNTDANTTEIQPAIKLLHSKDDGTKNWVQFPVLKDVPIHYYGGGGTTLTVPITKGDEGMVIFSSRSIDKWWQQGGVQEQTAARMHDISDGIFFPGARSQPRKLKNVSATGFQLRTDKPASDGGSHFEFHPAADSASRAAGILPHLTMTIESGIRLNSFAGGILHAAGIALPDASLANTIGNIVHAAGHLPDIPAGIGQMIHHAINDITHNSVAGGIAHTALKAIGLNVGATRDIEERASKFAAGVSINLNSPIVQVSANLKAFGSIDAALGFFKNGIPIGGAGSGGGSSGGSSPPGPANGQPPPVQGDRWWDAIGGQGYFWYVDPSGAPGQWVADTNATGTPGTAQLDFPATPALNQMFTAPSGTMQWLWDGAKWTSPPALPLTGGTLTGNLTISSVAYPTLLLTKTVTGTVCQIASFNGANLRWNIALGDGAAESGGNAGSNFSIARYTDAGAYIDSPLTINRATGLLALSVPLPVTSGGTGSTSSSGALSNLGAASAASLAGYLPLTSGTLSTGLTVINSSVNNGYLAYNGNYGSWICTFNDGNGHLECPAPLWIQGNNTGQAIHLSGAVEIHQRATFDDGFAIYGGTFYNPWGNGRLYFDGTLQVWDFLSSNNINSSGAVYFGGCRMSNNGGWAYFDQPILSASTIQGTFLHSTGDVRADSWCYASVFGGGPGNAGYLLLFNAGPGVCFRWDGRLYYRISEAVERRFVDGNFVDFGPSSGWGGPTNWIYLAYDVNGSYFVCYCDIAVSDERIKQNIAPTRIDCLAALNAVQVSEFDYRPEVTPWLTTETNTAARELALANPQPVHIPIGFVGQHVQPHIPEAAYLPPIPMPPDRPIPTDSLVVAQSAFIPYLVRAVQQLTDRLEALEEKYDRVH